MGEPTISEKILQVLKGLARTPEYATAISHYRDSISTIGRLRDGEISQGRDYEMGAIPPDAAVFIVSNSISAEAQARALGPKPFAGSPDPLRSWVEASTKPREKQLSDLLDRYSIAYSFLPPKKGCVGALGVIDCRQPGLEEKLQRLFDDRVRP